MLAADAALVGELEDPLRPRIDRPVHRVAEAGHLRTGVMRCPRDVGHHVLCSLARRDASARILEQERALLRRPEDDRTGAEDARGDGTLQSGRVGRERHPRGDVRRHHPVLGDRDEQQVEEEALVVGRLVAGQQQVEVLGEGQTAHEVAREVTAPHLDAIGIGLADPRHRPAWPADGHKPSSSRTSLAPATIASSLR